MKNMGATFFIPKCGTKVLVLEKTSVALKPDVSCTSRWIVVGVSEVSCVGYICPLDTQNNIYFLSYLLNCGQQMRWVKDMAKTFLLEL
eukprot:c1100_g1_i1 orf=14-277(-)